MIKIRPAILEKAKKYLPLMAGVFIHILLACALYANYKLWLTAQTFFHVPLCCAIYLLFKRNLTFFKFSLICIVAFVLSKYEIIDLHLFRVFSQYDLFPQAFILAEWVNPQYTKLMVYLIVTPILFGLLLFKNQRSLERIFVFLSCLSGIALTGVLHAYVIKDFLSYNKELHLGRMESVVHYLEKLPNLPEPQLQDFCKNFILECKMNIRADELVKIIEDEKLSKYTNSEVKKFIDDPNTEKSMFLFSGVSVQKKNAEYIIGFVARKNSYSVYIDKEISTKTIWFFKTIFMKISGIGYFVWCWLFIVVGLLHAHYAALRKAKYVQIIK